MLKGCPSIVDALEERKIIYSSNELNELINLYRELKKRGLRRTETSIKLPNNKMD